MDEESYLEMNPITKMILGFVSVVLTSVTITTLNRVSENNIQIVKLEGAVVELSKKIEGIQEINKLKFEINENRMSILENNANRASQGKGDK